MWGVLMTKWQDLESVGKNCFCQAALVLQVVRFKDTHDEVHPAYPQLWSWSQICFFHFSIGLLNAFNNFLQILRINAMEL